MKSAWRKSEPESIFPTGLALELPGRLVDRRPTAAPPSAGNLTAPSPLYRARLWRIGLWLARTLPSGLDLRLARAAAALAWRLAVRRREIVVRNLLPIFRNHRPAAERHARKLFHEFALKLLDLWRCENGRADHQWFADWTGWEIFLAARARGRGVLLVTPHLGNWELGGPFLARRGIPLLVLTRDEPDPRLTALRRDSRARWGVETLVVGNDTFAILEIIRRLEASATVALLVDRPPPPTAVDVTLFGRRFSASIAAAELARASGCAIVPTFIVRRPGGYRAEILPEIVYDRARIGNRNGRIQLTGEIVRAFEPVIRRYAAQWYHFVSVWPDSPA